ncbi:MAG: hypothetical protein Q9160_007243 [Pyrenula sp. 1 TL-2023]
MAANNCEKEMIIVTNDVPSGRAVGKEVQYRAKPYGPVMRVEVTALKRDSGRWVYQVRDSDGRAIREKDTTEAQWIPESKLQT